MGRQYIECAETGISTKNAPSSMLLRSGVFYVQSTYLEVWSSGPGPGPWSENETSGGWSGGGGCAGIERERKKKKGGGGDRNAVSVFVFPLRSAVPLFCWPID